MDDIAKAVPGATGQKDIYTAALPKQETGNPLQNLLDPAKERLQRLDADIKELRANAPKKPDAPENDPMKAIGSLAAVIGVFGSMHTRQPLTAGLNALTGAITSQKQGNLEDYALKIQEYNKYTDYVMQHEKLESEAYKDILREVDKNYQNGINLLRVKLQSEHNSQMAGLKSEQMMLHVAELKSRGDERAEQRAKADAQHAFATGMTLIGQIEDPAKRAEATQHMISAQLEPGFNQSKALEVVAPYHPSGSKIALNTSRAAEQNSADFSLAQQAAKEFNSFIEGGKKPSDKGETIGGVLYSKTTIDKAVKYIKSGGQGIPPDQDVKQLLERTRVKKAPLGQIAPMQNAPKATTPAKVDEGALPLITSIEEFNKLPKGAQYLEEPGGKPYVK
jgi:hypothetical protein